jgi:hypothetical protein
MTLDQKNIDNSFKKFNEIFDNEITQEIMDGLLQFTNLHVDTNESQFLINEVYLMKVDELLHLFNKSDYIIELIVDNIIEPNNLCNMKPHELDPERYKYIIEKKLYENKKKSKGSSIFSCKKCKQSNCDVTQKQTRSADEPATTFVTCLECGFKFRF